MIPYLLRRLWQLVPTLAGAVLVTFLLFNAVGGSPASAVLGQHASAQALAEFDAAGGYDLPLFFGRWTGTRALPRIVFARATASEKAAWGLAAEEDALVLAPGEKKELPLAFALPEGETWRLRVRGKGLRDGTACQVFPSDAVPEIEAGPEGARVSGVRLERQTRGWWDSQLVHFLSDLVRGDWGTSTSLARPVTEIIAQGLLPTLTLTVPVLLLELVLSLAFALVAAWKPGGVADKVLVTASVALMSVNYIVWIVVAQYFFSYRLGLFPIWGYEGVRNLFLPVLIGAVTGMGSAVRFYRTVLLEERHKDYVRTALAKGLAPRRVLLVHILKNALSPVIVNVTLSIPYLFTGSLLLENFFGIPGLGYLALNAIHSSDFAVLRATVLMSAFLFAAANLLGDVALAAVDPRVKFS
jgi:peptide/nickel transport system permease protein